MQRKFALSNTISGMEIKRIRNKHNLSQKEFAQLMNVSKITVEKWENKKEPIKGTIVTAVKLLDLYPEATQALTIPEQKYSLRLYYMYFNNVCSIIDVDERLKKVAVYNFVNDITFRAFGANTSPTFHDYDTFLDSRCFPQNRNQIKLVLNDLNLPFYDPLLIIEKTEGRMEDDDFWIKIERNGQKWLNYSNKI